MNKEELIARIAELDPEAKVDSLRVHELRLVVAGLEAPGKIKELEDELGAISEQLTEAEAKPAAAKPGKFAEKVGEHKGKEVTMLVPKAQLDGQIVTPADFRKTPALLAKGIEMGAGYLRIAN